MTPLLNLGWRGAGPHPLDDAASVYEKRIDGILVQATHYHELDQSVEFNITEELDGKWFSVGAYGIDDELTAELIDDITSKLLSAWKAIAK